MQFVDLERYPIDDLTSERSKTLIKRCRDKLTEDGSLLLPGFIKSDAIEKMATQVTNLQSHNRCEIVTPYIFTAIPDDAGPTHPARKRIPQDVHAVAADQIPHDAMLMQIYDSSEVMAFLAAALGHKEIHQFDDEFQKINVMYMRDGGSRAWHFDGSDFVITLLLQASEQGGEIEYAPFIRGVDDEQNYDDVAKLFEGGFPTKVNRAEAGTLQLFNGRRTMHRVRAVYGAKQRIQSVLSYDCLPGQRAADEKNVQLYGERVARILEARRQLVDSAAKKRKTTTTMSPPMSPMSSPMKRIGRGPGKIGALTL